MTSTMPGLAARTLPVRQDGAPARRPVGRRAMAWLIGLTALALGLLVYLCDRPASHALLQPNLGFLKGRLGFGAVGGWLPSLVHPFAFSLFSLGLQAPRSPGSRGAIGTCGFWFAVNAAFEIGQHPQVRGPLAEALTPAFGQGPMAGALALYFLRGTFDVGDLIAAALGAGLAALVWRRLPVATETNDVR